MTMPKIPKPIKPKTPLEPEEDKSRPARERTRPAGRESAISAGRLTSRANTKKSSLLGGDY